MCLFTLKMKNLMSSMLFLPDFESFSFLDELCGSQFDCIFLYILNIFYCWNGTSVIKCSLRERYYLSLNSLHFEPFDTAPCCRRPHCCHDSKKDCVARSATSVYELWVGYLRDGCGWIIIFKQYFVVGLLCFTSPMAEYMPPTSCHSPRSRAGLVQVTLRR